MVFVVQCWSGFGLILAIGLNGFNLRVQFLIGLQCILVCHRGQSSHLYYLLFFVDLSFCVQSNLRQYADDTVLYRVIRSRDDELALQNDLQHIGTWCELNHMMLNSKKCKLMTITRSRNPPKPIYNINGSQILQNVDNYRYLGLIISRDLSWKQHINGIASKATRLNGFLGRVIKSRNTKILTTLYCSISRPLLEYAAPVWCPALSTQQDTFGKSSEALYSFLSRFTYKGFV